MATAAKELKIETQLEVGRSVRVSFGSSWIASIYKQTYIHVLV